MIPYNTHIMTIPARNPRQIGASVALIGPSWRVGEQAGWTSYSNIHASSHCVSNRRHSTKRICPDSGTSTSDDEASDFAKWFIVQGTDDTTPLRSLSPFALGKTLKAQIDTLTTVIHLHSYFHSSIVSSTVSEW